MRVPFFVLSLLLLCASRVSPQSTEALCASHDHPCRLGFHAVDPCAVCHPGLQDSTSSTPPAARWRERGVDRSLGYPDAIEWPDEGKRLPSASHLCLSCHDGVFGPPAEACRYCALVLRSGHHTREDVECSVCHDPHLDDRVAGREQFLHHRESCGDCHVGEMFLEADRLGVRVTRS